MSWGVKPAALVGHSMGENTAACLAGVMSFEDCVGLVHLRGALFDTVPAGGMLSVPMAAEDLVPLLGDDLDVASVNAPELSVASGPQAALDALAGAAAPSGVECQRIPIDIAAHSRMLEPILGRFGAYLRSIRLDPAGDPVRLQPHRPLHHRRRGDRSRLLGRPPARHGALRRLHLDARRRRRTASTSRSAPARR